MMMMVMMMMMMMVMVMVMNDDVHLHKSFLEDYTKTLSTNIR